MREREAKAAVRDRSVAIGLDTIPGVGKRAAEVVLAEIGADMSVFPTAGHLASVGTDVPGNNITGGKRKSGHHRQGNRWLRGNPRGMRVGDFPAA